MFTELANFEDDVRQALHDYMRAVPLEELEHTADLIGGRFTPQRRFEDFAEWVRNRQGWSTPEDAS